MRLTSLAVAMLLGASNVIAAQRGAQRQPPGEPQRGQPALAPQQQVLLRQVRQAFAGVVRRQLNLSADQSRKVQEIDTKYQRQRNDITRDEREARSDLRIALSDTGAAPDQAKVDGYLSRLVQAQRKRADLLEAEQKELAEFLNPVQRAKYLALKEQLQKRIAQVRAGGGRGARTPAPPPPQR